MHAPDLPADLAVDLAGTTVWLLPERALWWPEGAMLCLADLHLGKAATFRARGLPVPAGTTQGNLDRLAQLLARHPGVQRLVVLGDFLHAAEAHAPALLRALAAWREDHAALELVLVRGNHDRHAGDPPAWLGARIVDEPWSQGPFACCHHPQHRAGRWVLAGHLHPTAVLYGGGRDALRMPCFLAEPGLLVLPAFGEFTGGHAVPAAPGRQRFAVGAGRVWALP
ncbi:ligase-associated DNA damage response endonuclease PdeM [Diaphorobacter nitroreducens]|uniref:ligase-associated DNA damage response endonuclease PdeM n=2 Tax=Diaphorobacter TaxID=238749 RepID=UPI00289D63CB|nr:ligase-associated DNA damage response endonuclease PdeM [Diaphorobacter nitroreducens]